MKRKLYWCWFKHGLSMAIATLQRRFNHKFNTAVIPEGPYCYVPDTKKNAGRKDLGIYHIIPCPYYKTLGYTTNGCAFLGIITKDSLFDDQVKMCKENDNNI